MERINCHKCDSQNSISAKYCSGCGFELEKPKNQKETVLEIPKNAEASSKIKKISSVIVGIAAFVIAYLGVQYLFFDKPYFDKVLIQVSGEINKNCPLMLDQDTRLDGTVVLPDNTLQYNYTLVNSSHSEINITDLKNYLEPKIINNVKTSSDMKYFRDNRVTLVYHYQDKDGAFVLKIDVSPWDYK